MNDSFAGAHKFRRACHINKFQSAWLSYLFVTGGVINLNSAQQRRQKITRRTGALCRVCRCALLEFCSRARRTCTHASGTTQISNFLRLIILTLLTVKCTGINRAWESARGAHPPHQNFIFRQRAATFLESQQKKEKCCYAFRAEYSSWRNVGRVQDRN